MELQPITVSTTRDNASANNGPVTFSLIYSWKSSPSPSHHHMISPNDWPYGNLTAMTPMERGNPDNLETKGSQSSLPLWQRRGAPPIAPLQLDPLIVNGIPLDEKINPKYFGLEIVHDPEWVKKGDFYEIHPLNEIEAGCVINPPTIPALYKVALTGQIVRPQLPFHTEYFLHKLREAFGYKESTLIECMGSAVASYARGLIPTKYEDKHRILVLIGRHWQGSAATYAGYHLAQKGFLVSFYLHSGHAFTSEETAFLTGSGGTLYKGLPELRGQTFRVAIVALEDHNAQWSSLALFGNVLEDAIAVFVDPPVLKCSYSAALQVACNGSYDVCRKTAVFVPNRPKPFVSDKFIDQFVVDVRISREMHTQCGFEPFSFLGELKISYPIQLVQPLPYVSKEVKLYFYEKGKLVNQAASSTLRFN